MKRYGSCKIVSTLDEAELVAKSIAMGRYCNLIFEASYIKNHFFETLQIYNRDVSIINCDSKLERFENDILEAEDLIVFDNINHCKDFDLVKQVKNKVLIC